MRKAIVRTMNLDESHLFLSTMCVHAQTICIQKLLQWTIYGHRLPFPYQGKGSLGPPVGAASPVVRPRISGLRMRSQRIPSSTCECVFPPHCYNGKERQENILLQHYNGNAHNQGWIKCENYFVVNLVQQASQIKKACCMGESDWCSGLSCAGSPSPHLRRLQQADQRHLWKHAPCGEQFTKSSNDAR